MGRSSDSLSNYQSGVTTAVYLGVIIVIINYGGEIHTLDPTMVMPLSVLSTGARTDRLQPGP